ncbi:hypothetical protein [Glycomyces sp. NPDC047010]|uniref:hypothetical protein n=1 Tax=Glycomyces sp. NPDC047010 TaxID=3155023 RepID=UPI0033E75AD3
MHTTPGGAMDDFRTAPPRSGLSHDKIVNRSLWAGFVGGSILNAFLQVIGLGLLAIPFGVLALASGIGLVVRAVVRPKPR